MQPWPSKREWDVLLCTLPLSFFMSRATSASRPASNLKERPENWLLRIEIWVGKRRIFIKGLFVTSLCFPLSQHRGFYFPPSAEADGPPFSPERKTCYMLFISEAIAFLLSLSFSSSVILSFVPTYCNQLSTSRRLVPLSLQKGASFRKPNFFLASVFLRIHTAEEVQYITVILIDSHTVFYFPPGRPL